jgi:hypothetical protein
MIIHYANSENIGDLAVEAAFCADFSKNRHF